MGMRFRKSFGIGKGARLNIGKGSVGVSVGAKGARYSVNSKRGVTTSVGAPGTGISYSSTSGGSSRRSGSSGEGMSGTGCLIALAIYIVVVVVAFFALGGFTSRRAEPAQTGAATSSVASSLPAPEDPGLSLRRVVRAYVAETYGEEAVSKVTSQTATVDVDVLVPYTAQTPPADLAAVIDQAKAVAAGIPGVFPAGTTQTRAIVSLVDSDDNNLVVVGSDGKVYADVYSGPIASTAETAPAEKMVYVSASGSKYHSKPDCGNMSSATKITISEAQSRGLTACARCW